MQQAAMLHTLTPSVPGHTDPEQDRRHAQGQRGAVCQGARRACALPHGGCDAALVQQGSVWQAGMLRISLLHIAAAVALRRRALPPCAVPPQVTALAFPKGRPTTDPDPEATPVYPKIKNSLGQNMEVVYEWGERGWAAVAWLRMDV